MTPSPSFDRAYAAIKRRVCSGGWRPGQRVDAVPLADDLGISITPVRDALYRLIGERLLVPGESDGFAMPVLTETGLRNLYAWSLEVLTVALRGRSLPLPDAAHGLPSAHPVGERIASLFLGIAQQSDNGEHATVMEPINDRLHAARRMESRLFNNLEPEYADIVDSLTGPSSSAFRAKLSHYHRRRSGAVDRIVQLLYRPEILS